MNWGLKQRDINAIHKTFSAYDTIDEVIIFGSRAKGNYREGSDIDLVIKGNRFNPDAINAISAILNEELAIPYFIDVLYIKNIHNNELLEHIQRVGQPFYTKVNV